MFRTTRWLTAAMILVTASSCWAQAPSESLLASLRDRTESAPRNFTERQTVATSYCSVICSGAAYSATCRDGQACACSCDQRPVCECR